MPSDKQSDATTTKDTPPQLRPQQVCFVVDDVPTAVEYCEQRFGWGPFVQFKAPVPDATYKDWRGEKLTEVALGMAGKVQMEFLHVHKGHDTTADYQTQYGTGFQHIGIYCRARDKALAHLEALGASVNELNEYPGVDFAFVNVPTGPGMFEILQPTAQMKDNTDLAASRDPGGETLFDIDRTTIVTSDIHTTLAFYSGAFGWESAHAKESTLVYGGSQTTVQRYVGTAGTMQLELIQPQNNGNDPYSEHLQRGDHGLIHAGGKLKGELSDELEKSEALHCEWQESGERFALYDWAGGTHGLQIRSNG